MNKYPGAGQRKYLGFVLQAAEGTGKNKTVVIAYKGSSHSIGIGSFVFGATSFTAVELLPVHMPTKITEKPCRFAIPPAFCKVLTLSRELPAFLFETHLMAGTNP